MASKTLKALVLVDDPARKWVCGQVVELAAEQAEALHKIGRIDPHPEAVKAATPLANPQAADVIED